MLIKSSGFNVAWIFSTAWITMEIFFFLISFVLILMAMQCFKEEAEEDIECRKLKKH